MNQKILIVEDNRNLRDDLVRLIQDAFSECQISVAQNDHKAIELVGRTLFSLIIADIRLGDSGGREDGGFEVLRAAKQREPATQVILITSFPPQDIERIREWGADGYIDRSAAYYLDLLLRETRIALRYNQRQRRISLMVGLPERAGDSPWVQIPPRDSAMVPEMRFSTKPLSFDVELLRGAANAIGSFIYLNETEQRNAMTQFVGRYVWNRLFRDHDRILLALGETYGLAQRQNGRFIIRLNGNRESLDLPLELIHNGDDFLALRNPFVRTIRECSPVAASFPMLLHELRSSGQPLRVLLVASNTCSADLGPIPLVQQEIEAIQAVMIDPPFGPKIQLDVLADWQSSHAAMLKHLKEGYHIIHFAGHATYDARNSGMSKLFVWERPAADADTWNRTSRQLEQWYDGRRSVVAIARDLRGALLEISTHELANRFAASVPSLVYLSCCHSAQTGSARDLVFSKSLGLMDAVVREGVPIVVGHRWPLLDSHASVAFVQTFYDKLLAEYPPEEALYWARREVAQDDPTWASAVMVAQG